MDPDAIALFRELADRSPSEREEYYARHRVPLAVRTEVESLLQFDRNTIDSLHGYVAAAAERVLLSRPLAPGDRLGRYEVIAAAGAGGMGEVYQARDTALDRTVAVKVLPAHVAGDPNRKLRFEREARMLAGLSHPHICPVFDVGQHGDTAFLVMEFLDGETLADRLAKGPVPLEQGLRYAIQIADALAKAHGAGIVHRDLKPGNIMLTASGATLLDFGLAKPARPALETTASRVPTSPPLTDLGTILGTFQYMAPEQLEGREADARSDIFAFGAITHEMLTGKKAFEGNSDVSVIAAIMRADPPPVSASQPLTPPLLDHVVRTCLAKEPHERWQSAADVRRQLTWIAEAGVSSTVATAQPVRRAKFPWLVAAASLLVAAIAIVAYVYVAPSAPPTMRFSVSPPQANTFPASTTFFAISADGRSLAFTAVDSSDNTMLWMQPLDSVSPRRLAGTEGANSPFWSPDGLFVAFFAQGRLKTVNVADGSVQNICDVPDVAVARGGTWSPKGVIVFQMNTIGSLHRVSASGGIPTPATPPTHADEEQTHVWPAFLPDGTHFLYAQRTGGRDEGIYLAALDSKDVRLLLAARSNAVFASGQLLFGVNGDLMAQPFDDRTFQLSGAPVRIAERLLYNPRSWRTAFSASETGVLAYGGGGESTFSQLTWLDRSGKVLSAVGERREQYTINLSPDGTKVAVDIRDHKTDNHDIWLLDVTRGTSSRLTSHPSADSNPVWSPDGSRIAFASTRDDRSSTYDNLYLRLANGSDDEEPILKLDEPKIHQHPRDWSSDGRHILFERTAANDSDLWILPMFGDRTPFPFAQTDFQELGGHFSPDGRFVTYMSDETGRFEAYVRSFPGSGEKWQISVNGGTHPRWGRGGEELFFLDPAGVLMRVPVRTKGRFEPGQPTKMFDALLPFLLPEWPDPYALTPNGERFLVLARNAERTPVTVTINWSSSVGR